MTNEAEIIHFGGNVAVELPSGRWAPLISGRTAARGGVSEREGPRGGGDVMAIPFHAAHTKARREEGGAAGRGVPPAPGLPYFVCHSTGNALI